MPPSEDSFKDRPFAQRFKALGDQAEAVFERVYPEGWVRFGINRPPVNLSAVPAFVRYTPDYLTAKGLVEVQGFGSDQTFKLKVDKFDALEEWQRQFRTDLFVYDSKHNCFGWVRLRDLNHYIFVDGGGDLCSFPEGKTYWGVHADDLPLTDGWHDAEA